MTGRGAVPRGGNKTLGWEELQLLQPNLASTRVLGRVEGSRAECSSPKALDELHAGQGLEGVVGGKRSERVFLFVGFLIAFLDA